MMSTDSPMFKAGFENRKAVLDSFRVASAAIKGYSAPKAAGD